jgi:hypothetical protein
MKKIYLASPYYHKNHDIREQRFISVCKKAGELMNQGYFVYSPIAHSHPIAVQCELPKDWVFWEQYDIEYIKWVDEVWILQLDGWSKSKGISAEIEIAKSIGKPIYFIEP